MVLWQPPGQSQHNSFSRLQLSDSEYFSLQNLPNLHIYTLTATSLSDWPWCKAKNRWHFIDTHVATGISTICSHSLWYRIPLIIVRQPFYPLYVPSPSSLHCSLIMHISPSKYNFKCMRIVDNDTNQKSRCSQLILVFTFTFAQRASLVCKIEISCITTQQIVY
jgi:hypothetical protein